jgi:hypothetical protein
MIYNPKEISEVFQVSLPRARAIIKVCKGYDNADRNYLRNSYAYRLDKLCDTYGIEGIKEESLQYPDSKEIEFEYLNAGDTYQTTIIFKDNKTSLGSYGDMIEELEKEIYENLGHPRACICESCNHHCFYAKQDARHRLSAIWGEIPCPNCGGSMHYDRKRY